ncbi:tartrate dehydrogenase [Kwoniella mangroviensis CBS 10435]|uniref:D-malate dehydrogenase (decarboxylating) n=1 Tax=Kwoniella mangroviensis CBS 10435 TaxID=1331196 RepID=A0A1B9IUY5_9TREE|nr:tartrate dehydrogenase [Kwoniella mangroviensis CBS 10435]
MSPIAIHPVNETAAFPEGYATQPERKSTYKIAQIGADGIGPEVIEAGVQAVHAVAKKVGTFKVDFSELDWSSDRYKKTGSYVPVDYIEILKKHDAIFFGAVGAPDVPDHISLWGLRLAICQPYMYANVRRTKVLPGTSSPLKNLQPGQLDWCIIRENSEGEYAGHGGRSHRSLDHEIGTEVTIFTRTGIRRIARYAFQVAQSRPRKLLNYVTKSNAMRNGMVLWDEVINEVSKEFPDVTMDHMLVDAMTVRMTLHPDSLDTILATNLHADILSDLAAALAGSIGIAPTANIDPSRTMPSMFEPIHGSAFDITGMGIANPVGTFWSACEMLDWLGEHEASKVLMKAVEQTCADGITTKDLGGSANTREVTDAVIQRIRAL